MTFETLHVPLHSRRLQKARVLQHLQHAIPGVALLAAGVNGLVEKATGVALLLTFTEIGSSLLLLLAIGRHARHHMRSHESTTDTSIAAVSWVDLWAGVVLAAEAWERWYSSGHFARPTILLALLTLGMALSHGHITRASMRRRALTLTDDGLSVGGRLWRGFRAQWTDIAEISVTSDEAVIRTVAGRCRRIDLADLYNAEEVRSAIRLAQHRVPPLAVRPAQV